MGELYDEMLEKDTDLSGLFGKRFKAVLQLPRYIRPGDSSPQARETALFAHQALALIPQRDVNIKHTLMGVARGIAINELIWEKLPRGPLAGAWVPVDTIDRPMWRFAFDAPERRLHVRRRTALPVLAPPLKFQRFTYGTKDNPWGKDALLDLLYWFYFLKKHGAKYWALHTERFAMPHVDASYKHRPGNTPEAESYNKEQQLALLKIVDEIKTGSAAIHPDGTTIKFLEAARGGDASYGSFISWLTRGEALLILGEVDTSGLARGPGSFAKSVVSNDVRLETVQHDAKLLSAHESDTLLRWITEINFGPDAPAPKMVYDAMDAADRTQRAKGIESALAAGEKVPRSYARMTWQVQEVEVGEEFIQRSPSQRAAARPVPQEPEPQEEAEEEPQEDEEEEPAE